MESTFPLPHGIYRATLAIVDLDAVTHNLYEIRRNLPPQAAVCAIVKADAYGHGAVPVSRELEARGVNSLGVATVEEGLELRGAGIRLPILVFGMGAAGIETAVEHQLTPIITSSALGGLISEAARKRAIPVPVHLKLDTGMGRLGLLPDQLPSVLETLGQNPWIRIEGVASHFSSADSDPDFTRDQLKRFLEAVDQVARCLGTTPKQIHIANSAGILNHPETAHTMVRPGIALYGAYPEKALATKIKLKPAMTLKTRVLYLKSVPPGSPISYGQTYRTKRLSRIATLAAGYADGYRRELSNCGEVLIRGLRAPVVGTVTMDFIMVDVSDVPGVVEGDEVILFGHTSEGTLPVDDLAEKIGTIPYELLCAVSRRVPRVYCRNGKIVDI